MEKCYQETLAVTKHILYLGKKVIYVLSNTIQKINIYINFTKYPFCLSYLIVCFSVFV